MAGTPTHRSEATGNAALDRIQNNVRDLIAFTKTLVARVVRSEPQHGTATMARIDLTGKTSYTLTDAQSACRYWLLVGALAADCTVRIPRGTDAAVYERLVYHAASGGFNITVTNDDGSILLAPADSAHFIVYADGPESWA